MKILKKILTTSYSCCSDPQMINYVFDFGKKFLNEKRTGQRKRSGIELQKRNQEIWGTVRRFYKNNDEKNSIYVLYGDIEDFGIIAKNCENMLSEYNELRYISCDIHCCSGSNSSVIFEIIQLICDECAEKSEKWMQKPIDISLRKFRKLNRSLSGEEDAIILAELVRFLDLELKRRLSILFKTISPVVIGLKGFEKVLSWSKCINRFLFSFLLETEDVHILIFSNDSVRPILHLGSDESKTWAKTVFHEINETKPNPETNRSLMEVEKMVPIEIRVKDAEEIMSHILEKIPELESIYVGDNGNLKRELASLLGSLRANMGSYSGHEKISNRQLGNPILIGQFETARLNLENVLAEIQVLLNDTFRLELIESIDSLRVEIESGQKKSNGDKKTFLDRLEDLKKKFNLPLEIGKMAMGYGKYLTSLLDLSTQLKMD